jgi:hypothetical protein
MIDKEKGYITLSIIIHQSILFIPVWLLLLFYYYSSHIDNIAVLKDAMTNCQSFFIHSRFSSTEVKKLNQAQRQI